MWCKKYQCICDATEIYWEEKEGELVERQESDNRMSKAKIQWSVFFDLKDWALPFRISLWIKRKPVKHIVAQIGPVEIIFVWWKQGKQPAAYLKGR